MPETRCSFSRAVWRPICHKCHKSPQSLTQNFDPASPSCRLPQIPLASAFGMGGHWESQMQGLSWLRMRGRGQISMWSTPVSPNIACWHVDFAGWRRWRARHQQPSLHCNHRGPEQIGIKQRNTTRPNMPESAPGRCEALPSTFASGIWRIRWDPGPAALPSPLKPKARNQNNPGSATIESIPAGPRTQGLVDRLRPCQGAGLGLSPKPRRKSPKL